MPLFIWEPAEVSNAHFMNIETKALREGVFDKGHKRELDLKFWTLILGPVTCLRDNLLIN